MSIRDIKRKARRDLHQAMSVPALYIAYTGAEPVPCTVRVHTHTAPVGQLAGFAGAAERLETAPKLRFDRSEVAAPARTAIVSVEPGEAYRISNPHPADDAFVFADVTRLSAAEATGLPVPE